MFAGAKPKRRSRLALPRPKPLICTSNACIPQSTDRESCVSTKNTINSSSLDVGQIGAYVGVPPCPKQQVADSDRPQAREQQHQEGRSFAAKCTILNSRSGTLSSALSVAAKVRSDTNTAVLEAAAATATLVGPTTVIQTRQVSSYSSTSFCEGKRRTAAAAGTTDGVAAAAVAAATATAATASSSEVQEKRRGDCVRSECQARMPLESVQMDTNTRPEADITAVVRGCNHNTGLEAASSQEENRGAGDGLKVLCAPEPASVGDEGNRNNIGRAFGGLEGDEQEQKQQEQPSSRKRRRPTNLPSTSWIPITVLPFSSFPAPPPSPEHLLTRRERGKRKNISSPGDAAVGVGDRETVGVDSPLEAESMKGGKDRDRQATKTGIVTSATPKKGEGLGERCPVCGSAVWGLGVRARQVHINSCLDGMASGEVGVDDAINDYIGMAGELGTGGSVAPSSNRRTRKPKTEFQEHIQMAKALSKSLVEVAPMEAMNEPDNEEDAARNPANFRAKEKRLLATLKELDAKLERLHKDRDAALKKLAAHRALGAKVSLESGDSGENGSGAPKTVEEVIDKLFSEEKKSSRKKSSPLWSGGTCTSSEGAREMRRTEKASLAWAPSDAIFDRETARQRCPDHRSLTLRGGEGEEGHSHSIVRGSNCSGDRSTKNYSASTKSIRRRSSGGCNARGRLLSSGGRSLWGIAQEADELSQSNFVTGVFADVRAGASAAALATEKEGGTRKPWKAVEVTAAAYGEASLYNRKSTGSVPACTIVTNRSSLDLTSSELMDPRTEENYEAEQEDPVSCNDDTATGDTILWLSQTLPSPRSESVPPKRNNLPGSGDALASAEGVSTEMAHKLAAQHIACAPLAAVSALFPDWEENVRFIFRQNIAELRKALKCINATLSEDKAAVAAAMEVKVQGACREDGLIEEKPEDSGLGKSNAKAEALLFFESVILEALELRASGRLLTTPPADNGEESVNNPDVALVSRRPNDKSDSGNLANGTERVTIERDRVEEEGGIKIDGGDTYHDVWDNRGDFCSAGEGSDEKVAGTATGGGVCSNAPDELVTVQVGSAKSSSHLGKSSNHSNLEDACLATGDEESPESIVLSGDSYCDAIMTFESAESESSRCSVDSARPAAAAEVTELLESPGGVRLCTDRSEADMEKYYKSGATAVDCRTESVECDLGADNNAREYEGFVFDFSWNDLVPPHLSNGVGNPDSIQVPPPPSPPLPSGSPGSTPAARYGGSEEEPERCLLNMPGSGRQLVLNPARTAAVALSSRLLENAPSPSPNTLTTTTAPTASGGVLAKPLLSEQGRVYSEAGLSLTQRVPSRNSRHGAETTVTLPVRSISQPIGVRSTATRPTPLELEEDGDTAADIRRSRGVVREAIPLFDQMTLQELTCIMSIYGLKKKSKREMVERLENIWKALHSNISSAASDNFVDDGRGFIATRGISNSSRPTSPQGWKELLDVRSTVLGPGSARSPLGMPSGDQVGSSQRVGREMEKAPLASSRQQGPSSTVAACEDKKGLGEQIQAILTGHAQLHEDILLLTTVELSATQRLLKDAGVKCSKRDLGSYLDDKGITFVDRGTGAGRAKGAKGREKAQKKRRLMVTGTGTASASEG